MYKAVIPKRYIHENSNPKYIYKFLQKLKSIRLENDK